MLIRIVHAVAETLIAAGHPGRATLKSGLCYISGEFRSGLRPPQHLCRLFNQFHSRPPHFSLCLSCMTCWSQLSSRPHAPRPRPLPAWQAGRVRWHLEEAEQGDRRRLLHAGHPRSRLQRQPRQGGEAGRSVPASRHSLGAERRRVTRRIGWGNPADSCCLPGP